ncbi:ABC transporter permease DevC [Singulisphaera acidiphila]|uniref:DevC protein n=1 Tax=Singulisphaera acidiphila (strain ATCC BAA-1392 / DSM 18658 / VKM B-2454 / MOB10) TaxID=886293 RepID=L0DJQ2_SINAD|nr:ABC transporter permease DevC [Singulisphaera acidiphila]AGA29075.1 DevC protein [Singulisphaera acidiphila DSM 18658]
MTLTRMATLAWLNLVHDKRRLAVSMAGVSFAVVLMTMELGFRFALLDSMVEIVRLLDTDLVIASKSKSTLVTSAPFNRRILQDALSVREVEEACPLYIETRFSALRNPNSDRSTGDRLTRKATARKIRVLAYDPRDHLFFLPEVESKTAELEAPETALYDEKSNRAIGQFTAGHETSLAQRSLRIVGTFRLGTDLVNDGNLIMSNQNFLRYFPDRRFREPELRSVELGLIRLAPGADGGQVRRWLEEELGPRGVNVFTKDQFLAREREFWDLRTPIGTIFSVGALLGLVVGAVICYQILSSEIADHLAEYATLKAMGYANHLLVAVVMAEALVLAVAGFVPGLLISFGLYRGLAWYTGLLMNLTPARALLVLGLTVVMCLGSGVFAMRKLLSADPAGLF